MRLLLLNNCTLTPMLILQTTVSDSEWETSNKTKTEQNQHKICKYKSNLNVKSESCSMRLCKPMNNYLFIGNYAIVGYGVDGLVATN